MTTMALLMDLSVGKSATARIIESAAAAYAERGSKVEVLPLPDSMTVMTRIGELM